MSTPKSKVGLKCNAPGDQCLECAHFWDDADKCTYSPEPKPAVVTEAHFKKLAELDYHLRRGELQAAAQLIADSEARAVEEAESMYIEEVKRRFKDVDSLAAERDALRADLARAHEGLDERDRLREEVKRQEQKLALAVDVVKERDQLRADAQRLLAEVERLTKNERDLAEWERQILQLEIELSNEREETKRWHKLKCWGGTPEKIEAFIMAHHDVIIDAQLRRDAIARAERAEADAAEQARLNGKLVDALEFIAEHAGTTKQTELGEIFCGSLWVAEQARAAVNSAKEGRQ